MKNKKLSNSWNFPNRLFKIFLVFILIILAQLFYLTLSPVIFGINMKQFALMRNSTVKTLYADRGVIYDANGNKLAQNVSAYTVIAYLDESRTKDKNYPKHVNDPDLAAAKLAPVLGMEEEFLRELLTRDAYQVELGPGGRGITELKKDEIEALELPGIDFTEEYKRNYPNGNFASYIIGYAKKYETELTADDEIKQGYEIIGELGIEAEYNSLLSGKDGYLKYQRDRYGYKIPDTKEIRQDAVDGNDIYLTIDSGIQRFIEGEIKEAATEYNPEWFQFTVMDAKTGAIVGTSSVPSFDPNIRDIENFENPLVSYVYEPGSTLKTFTYMCAMENGVYDGAYEYLTGKYEIYDKIISDWDSKGWGILTLDEGYKYSSNVGIANIFEHGLTKAMFKECLEDYGFGVKTGINLPRELNGRVVFNYPIEVVAAGFGQGVESTAIQMLQAYSLIANDGKLVKPYIVEKIIDSNSSKIVYEHTVEKTNQKVSSNTINKMKDLMYSVVHDEVGATGRVYKIEGFDIMAKTGTAQIFNTTTGRYMNGVNDYIYSVALAFPKNDPKYIIYGALKRPSYGGSLALSNATKEIIKSIAKYENLFSELEPDSSISIYEMPSFINKNLDDVTEMLDKKNTNYKIVGDGEKVISQYPASKTSIMSSDTVFLKTESTKIKVPNFYMWAKKDVSMYCTMASFNCKLDGYGYVKSQSLNSGSIYEKEEITFKLEEKYQDVLNPEEDLSTEEEAEE